MKSFLISLILFILISSTAKAQAYNIIDDMKNREKILWDRLATTKDAAEKQKIRDKLKQLQELYYDDAVRVESIRKKNPAYAAAIIASEGMEAETTEEESESNWEPLSKQDKTIVCKQAFDECSKNRDLYFCRFTVTRCRDYINKPAFDALVEKLKKR